MSPFFPRPKEEEDLDDIRVILRRNGAETTEVDRLAKIASDMCELEWKLLRREATLNLRARTYPSVGNGSR